MEWSASIVILTKRNKNCEPLRFTPEDIVRAIDGVEAAGLPVYGVGDHAGWLNQNFHWTAQRKQHYCNE